MYSVGDVLGVMPVMRQFIQTQTAVWADSEQEAMADVRKQFPDATRIEIEGFREKWHFVRVWRNGVPLSDDDVASGLLLAADGVQE